MCETQTASLNWPGKEFPAVLTDAGWAHVEPPDGFDFGFDKPLSTLQGQDVSAIVVRGERLAALETLRGAITGRLSLVYVDVPRLSHTAFAHEQLRVSTWLSLLRAHVGAAARLLENGGRIVVHIDDEGAALTMLVLDELLGQPNRETTVLWEKKYGPQNDLRGRIDVAQDYLLVYRVGVSPPESRLGSAWWSWQYAGKSEDGTREAEQLRDSGVITLPDIPKTSKPVKLIENLLDAYTEPGDLMIECFSDTGFAAAAAISKQRLPILLGGATDAELDRLDRCSIPRLEDGAGGQHIVAQFALYPTSYTPAAVNAGGEPITLCGFDHGLLRERELRPILIQSTGADVAPSARNGFPPTAIKEESARTVFALEPVVRCDVTVALFDWTEQSPPPGEMQMRVSAAARLLEADGVVAVATRHLDYAAVRLLGEMNVFGRSHYLGTIATEPTNGHPPSLITLFKALPNARLGKIGLPVEREFVASDGDPRGPWRDPGHKGARNGGPNTAFDYRLPPYRWELVSGELPPGAWRVNCFSGVIWSPRLKSPGLFPFRVRVTDSAGNSAEAECTIAVTAQGRPSYPEAVWWMDRPATASGSRPTVTTTRLPDGIVGEPYCAILEAEGGQPTLKTTAPGKPTESGNRTRYWEFSRKNLVTAILDDRAIFGATGNATPRIKKPPEQASIAVELGWWDKKRLSGQSPVLRLVAMLTKPGDLVMLAGGHGADDVLKSGRRCIYLGEKSDLDDRFPFIGRVGEPIAVWDPGRRAFRPTYSSPDFAAGLPWTQGFLPPDSISGASPLDDWDGLDGVSSDASEALVILGEADWPTRSRCEELRQRYSSSFTRVHVLYYRGRPPKGLPAMAFWRIPFDLSGSR